MTATPNIVFIDFDEVLNTRHSMFLNSVRPNKLVGSHGKFSKDAVELFKLLLDRTSSKFVVTSSWRANTDSLLDPSNAHIHLAFEEAGFTNWRDYVAGTGVTKKLNLAYADAGRGQEIDLWLNDNHCREANYVIIDDDSDFLPKQWPRFVQVGHLLGFEVLALRQASRILGQPINWNS